MAKLPQGVCAAWPGGQAVCKRARSILLNPDRSSLAAYCPGCVTFDGCGIDRGVSIDAAGPVALRFYIAPCLIDDRRPSFPMLQQLRDCVCDCFGAVGGKQNAGLSVADHLVMAA